MEQKARQIGERDIPIKDIKVGDRIRDDLGDLASLQLSLELHGLLMPVIVEELEGSDGKYQLIDGERRLQTLKRMNKTTVHARLFASLDDLKRQEIELELCIKRQDLHYAEEARAVRNIVEERKRRGLVGGLAKFGSSIRNKDIAESLGLSPPYLSQCLTIAQALDEHPALETTCNNRTQALKAIARKEFITPQESLTRQMYEECYPVMTPIELLDSIDGRLASLIILHPETVDTEMLELAESKLKLGGSLIIFSEMADLGGWYAALGSTDLHVETQPMIWNVKGEGNYYSYLWCGKNRSAPLRVIPPHVTHPRSPEALSLKAKAPMLIKRFIHSCTESGEFVVVPDCQDIETIKIAYDMKRNIRAACNDKVLRDRLIMLSGR